MQYNIEAETLRYDESTREYVSTRLVKNTLALAGEPRHHIIHEVYEKERKCQEPAKPKGFVKTNQGPVADVLLSDISIVLCLGLTIVTFNPLYLVPLGTGLIYCGLNVKNASASGMVGRSRKGRTNKPLYDIENDCLTTKFNN